MCAVVWYIFALHSNLIVCSGVVIAPTQIEMIKEPKDVGAEERWTEVWRSTAWGRYGVTAERGEQHLNAV